MKLLTTVAFICLFTLSAFYSTAFGQANSVTFFQKNGLWGLRHDTKGKIIVKPKYSNKEKPWFGGFSDDLAVVEKNGKFGLIDKTGKEIVPIQFDAINNVHFGNIIQVSKNNKWALLNISTQKEISTMTYQSFEYVNGFCSIDSDAYENGFFLKTKNGESGKCGLVKVNESSVNEILPIEYNEIIAIGNIIMVRQNDKWGCFDCNNNPIIPIKYSYIEFYPRLDLFLVGSEGGKKVKNSEWSDDRYYSGGNWGFLNKTGKEFVALQYDYVRPKPDRKKESEGPELVKVGKNNKFGLVDLNGKVIIQLKYDEIDDNIYSFNDFMDILPYSDENGLFKVKLNGKWGMINSDDKTIIPIFYDKIEYLSEIYEATLNDEITNFDKTGKKLEK